MPNPGVERRARALCAPILFALALAVVASVILSTLRRANIDLDSDDGYYLKYMQAVHARGLSAFPGLFDDWNADPENWIYPPPNRIGFVVASALWAELFGPTVGALKKLSVAAHLCGAIINYVFARRRLGEPRALFAGVLWAFSPLLMGLARLPLTDSFIAACTSLSVWLLLEVVEAPASRVRRVLFMAAFAFTVLVKEQAVLLAVPFAAFVLVERLGRRAPLPLGTMALTLALPAVAAVALMALAAGGPGVLVETSRHMLQSPATNEYATKYCSGPWFRYLIDYLCLSPGPTLLAIGFAGVLALRLRSGSYDRTLVLMGLIAVLFLFEFSFFIKSVRYAVVLELPIRVFAVCMLGELLETRKRVLSTLLCGAAVALLCWLDWRTFDLYWVDHFGYDPHSHFLLGVRHVIPFPYR